MSRCGAQLVGSNDFLRRDSSRADESALRNDKLDMNRRRLRLMMSSLYSRSIKMLPGLCMSGGGISRNPEPVEIGRSIIGGEHATVE